ncbi:hypothetical protein [Pseudomonas simiae]|uniref:hypothetical protein n=1 Tax=Pseudomonas simiae TaxID=321846 RepID=UPI0011B28746|nr:hypothetical protein [Pseudomonas simiae]
MIYEQTIILKDDDSHSFPEALDGALATLKALAKCCPTIVKDTFKERKFERSFKVDLLLDEKGSEDLCLNLAEKAALIVGLGGVTGVRLTVLPTQHTACFELLF